MSQRLYEKLAKLNSDGLYPFHMPGHKRNINASNMKSPFEELLKGAYEIDITEIDGFDNLHDAKELILDAEKNAARLYKSSETHFLVNGSTSGILTAISSVCNRGDKIIVARNCHISVYNAIEINGLEPVYVYPEIVGKSTVNAGIAGSIRKEAVEKLVLSNLDAKAIVVTSPTYDGVLSDIAGISRVAHEYDIPLIVDEAHGALFFKEGRSAVDCGADIVINSLHKTLPALTMTALIHVNGNIVDRNRIKKYLRIYQTSSPSYILMASIDYAMAVMEEEGNRLYREFCIRLTKLKAALIKLNSLVYINRDMLVGDGAFDFDESKILISTSGLNLSGKDLYDILVEKYKLQPEMAAGDYVLLMTTLFDSDEGIEKLISALNEIDKDILNKKIVKRETDNHLDNIEDTEKLDCFKASKEKPSTNTVYAYPPGIPIIVSGEIITDEHIQEIEKAVNDRLDIKWVD